MQENHNVPDSSLYHDRQIIHISRKSIHLCYRDDAKRDAAAPTWETLKQSTRP